MLRELQIPKTTPHQAKEMWIPQSSQSEFQQTSSSDLSLNNEYNLELSIRPKIQVGPRGIGPVADLNENDVLCGRGGRINSHYGNIQFRKYCGEKRDEYFTRGMKKVQKAHIAASVVERIRSMDPPGRFLKQDKETGEWFDIGCAKAMTKAGQAIREHTPKEEDGDFGELTYGLLGQRQERKNSILGFSGPLYPGFRSIDTETPREVPPLAVNSPFASREIYPSPVANTTISFATTNDSSTLYEPSFDLGVTHPVAFRSEMRLSTLSAMSGVSRMSALMRASVQSDFSDVMSTSPLSTSSSIRETRVDSLLRQSVLSDISDCMSAISLRDGRPWTADNNLVEAEEKDMGLVQSSSTFLPGPTPKHAFTSLSTETEHVFL